MEWASVGPVIIASILSGGGAIVIMIIRESFMKGKQSAALKMAVETTITLKSDMSNLRNEMGTLSIQIHKLQEGSSEQIRRIDERIDVVEKDHTTMETVIKDLSDNLSKVAQQIAASNATMKGLDNLLQNIFNGNLKINTKR